MVLIGSLYLSTCFTKRSVRFDALDGLRVLESTDKTRLPRLPWSFGAVPQRYELLGQSYRIVFETPDRAVPFGLFVASAQRGQEDVFIDGMRFHSNAGGDARYYVDVWTKPAGRLEFSVVDSNGGVLGRHTLTCRMVAYSYLCGFEGT
jgi:hypothetical protein